MGLALSTSTYAQKYFGKSYERTQFVDEFYDTNDVKKPYTVMGKAELQQGFRSLEKSQKKIIDLAKKKGADGVIFSIEEEVYGTSTSSGSSINDGKKDKTTGSTSSATVDLKQNIIKGTLIKYE